MKPERIMLGCMKRNLTVQGQFVEEKTRVTCSLGYTIHHLYSRNDNVLCAKASQTNRRVK